VTKNPFLVMPPTTSGAYCLNLPRYGGGQSNMAFVGAMTDFLCLRGGLVKHSVSLGNWYYGMRPNHGLHPTGLRPRKSAAKRAL